MAPQKHRVHAHFNPQGKHPKFGNYKVVSCKKCDAARGHILKAHGRLVAPELFTTRIEVLQNHVNKCIYHNGANPSEATGFAATEEEVDLSGEEAAADKKRPSIQLRFQPTVITPLDSDQKKEFHRLALEMVAACGLPEGFFEQPSVVRVLEFLRPGCEKILPSARTVGGPLLAKTAKLERDKALDLVKNDLEKGGGLPLAMDGWKTTSGEHLIGVLVGHGKDAFPYEQALGTDGELVEGGNVQRGDEFDGMAAAKEMEAIKTNVEGLCEHPVAGVCTDDAGQYSRGRAILALRHPQLCWLKCTAHDVNNMFKAVFWSNASDLREGITLACDLVDVFKGSEVWGNRLWNKMQELYHRSVVLHRAVKTRWTTGQACFASLLRSKTAIKSVCTEKYKDGDPEAVRVIANGGDAPWKQFAQAERLAAPLAQANLWMQRPDVRLADALMMYGFVYLRLAEEGTQYAAMVEARWRKREQPLWLVAACLHPKHGPGFRERLKRSSTLTEAHMTYFVLTYYIKFIGDDTEGVADAAMKWVRGDVPEQQLSSSSTLWALLRGGEDEGLRKLAVLAQKLDSFPIHTAGCERLFSEFSYIHTKTRNRLSAKKVHQYAQIKRAVRKRDLDAQDKRQRQRRRLISPVELPRHSQEVTAAATTDEPEVCYEVEAEIDEDEAVGGVGDAWAEMLMLEYLSEDEEEEVGPAPPHNIGTAGMAREVQRMKHDTGEEHRRLHPFPEQDDKDYPQEKLTGTRRWRMLLSELFPPELELPELPNELLPFVE
eukprot:GHVU01201583.1.p1 GENE.GHVU01201583.1~~GHVU01201583.1.p1  ORF type:complete len:772 (+),score=134.34 GHVU01201583.1:149-2464(+)